MIYKQIKLSVVQQILSAVKILHALALSVSKLASSVENLCKDVCKVTDRVTEMEKRPGKKWDHLTSIIITAIASGIIGIIITSIFMKIS